MKSPSVPCDFNWLSAVNQDVYACMKRPTKKLVPIQIVASSSKSELEGSTSPRLPLRLSARSVLEFGARRSALGLALGAPL